MAEIADSITELIGKMPLLRFDRFAQKLNLEAVIIGKFEDTLQTGRSLARTEGLLSGISSGAALWAVAQTAVRSENKTILVNSAGYRRKVSVHTAI